MKQQPTSVFLLKIQGQRNLASLQSKGLQRVGHNLASNTSPNGKY